MQRYKEVVRAWLPRLKLFVQNFRTEHVGKIGISVLTPTWRYCGSRVIGRGCDVNLCPDGRCRVPRELLIQSGIRERFLDFYGRRLSIGGLHFVVPSCGYSNIHCAFSNNSHGRCLERISLFVLLKPVRPVTTELLGNGQEAM